jgi:predicted DNA-binding transcriptional regulator AlpA
MPLDPTATYITPKQMNASPYTYLMAREAAKHAGVEVRTVYHAIKHNGVPKFICGKYIYVRWEDFADRQDSIHPCWRLCAVGNEMERRLGRKYRRQMGLHTIRRVKTA